MTPARACVPAEGLGFSTVPAGEGPPLNKGQQVSKGPVGAERGPVTVRGHREAIEGHYIVRVE